MPSRVPLSAGAPFRAALALWLAAAPLAAQTSTPSPLAQPARELPAYAIDAADLQAPPAGLMRACIERFATDQAALLRRWDAPGSAAARAQQAQFLVAWQGLLDGLDFTALDQDGRIDWLLLAQRLRHAQGRLEIEGRQLAEALPLLPFADELVAWHEARRALLPVDPEQAAGRLAALAAEVSALEHRVGRDGQSPVPGDTAADAPAGTVPGTAVAAAAGPAVGAAAGAPAAEPILVTRVLANRAAGQVRALRDLLGAWYRHGADFDPEFTWWCEQPFGALDEALGSYARHLRETVAGIAEDDSDTLLGDPIGRDALLVELEQEFIPYTPEELLAIAEEQFAWCDAAMLEASRALGYGDDWRAAQEYVESLHVAPGEQPELIRELAQEAVDFLQARDLLTIPDFCQQVWRLEMMSPERQKYTPFFTGGEVISVAYPTAGMAHSDKLMAMRGNNVHFSRATVHHELIPGHHLQAYMTERHRSHRRVFETPFWGEGWALYWEMLLWDEGFARGPEDEIGMLFWRKHRCARILFSLRFHLGQMTPEECVALLVERVGHEPRNATAEVRRSIQGGYSPLYQSAYMLGGLQFRALNEELVGGGVLSQRAFHDAVLRQGPIPVELVRAALTGRELSRDERSSWRFAD